MAEQRKLELIAVAARLLDDIAAGKGRRPMTLYVMESDSMKAIYGGADRVWLGELMGLVAGLPSAGLEIVVRREAPEHVVAFLLAVAIIAAGDPSAEGPLALFQGDDIRVLECAASPWLEAVEAMCTLLLEPASPQVLEKAAREVGHVPLGSSLAGCARGWFASALPQEIDGHQVGHYADDGSFLRGLGYWLRSAALEKGMSGL